MKLKNKIVALALVVASAFGLAVSNRATKVEAADGETTVEMKTFTSVNDKMDDVVSYKTSQGGGTTAPAVNSGVIRLYQPSSGKDYGGTITISVVENYELTSVTIGTGMKTSISYTLNNLTELSSAESLASGAKKTVEGPFSSITFYCKGADKNSRLYVNYLSATYKSSLGELPTGEAISKLDTNVQLGLSYYKNTTVAEGSENSAQTISTKIQDYAGENGWANGTKYTSIEMDSNITVTAGGSTNTGKYYTSGFEWRIYQTESPTITFTANDNCEILSIKITYNIGNTGVLTFNSNNITSGTAVEVNEATATFGVGNSGSATNGQVKITAIEVVYSSGGPTETITYDTFCNAKLRYVANVPASLVESLDFADDQFGFELTLGEKTTEYTLKNANITVEEDGSYTFALIVNVPEEHYDDVVKVRAFVTTLEDGEIAYLDYSVEDFSVNSLAQYYIDNNKVADDEYDALVAFLG